MFWSHTHDDLIKIVGLKTAEAMARTYQEYETLRLVIQEALGGTKNSGVSNSSSEVKHIQSFDELASAFKEIGGVVG